MNKAWQRYLDTASGLTALTRQGAERVVRGLVKQGEVAADQLERSVDELLRRSEHNRKAIADLVKVETEKAVGRLGLAQQREVDELRRRLASLERRDDDAPATAATSSTSVATSASPAPAAPATPTTVGIKKTAAAKKAAAKKAAAENATAATKTAAAAKKTAAAKKANAASKTSPAKKTTPPGSTRRSS